MKKQPLGARCCAVRVWGLTIFLFWGLSCGGGASGDGSSATGTIRGKSVPTNDVIAVVLPAAAGVATVQIVYANFANACSVIQREFSAGGPEPANLVGLSLALTAAGMTVPAGTYPIGGQPLGGQSAGQSAAHFDTTDANCATILSPDATSGTISYGPVSATTIQGSFDVAFGGDRVSGHFTAPVCNLNQGNLAGSPPCGH